MIILDTNVISELWKAVPDPNVLAWVDAQMVETLYLSAITVAELRFGLDASKAYGDLMAQAKVAGRAIGKADGYIAATTAARGLMVATRDTNPFEAAGLNIIPWETRTDERRERHGQTPHAAADPDRYSSGLVALMSRLGTAQPHWKFSFS